MKKIMFNDKYALTKAVLEGRKTQMRHVAYDGKLDIINIGWHLDGKNENKLYLNGSNFAIAKSYYKINEEIAIAQPYKDIHAKILREVGDWDLRKEFRETKGYTDKRYVLADKMPHRIHITNIRIERLQDISDEDCLKEGINEIYENGVDDSSEFYGYAYLSYATPCIAETYNYPQEAYAALINLMYGKGTWERNPYVFVYDFELLK